MQVPSTKPDVPMGLNRFSSKVTQPKSQGASQAMLYATGLSEDDMDKPQVSSTPDLAFEAAAVSARPTRCDMPGDMHTHAWGTWLRP